MIARKLAVLLAVAALALPGSAVVAAPSVERGDYLVNSIMGCGNCHTPVGPNGPEMDKVLAGGMVVDDSAAMKAISANITPGGEIAGWTDAQLAKAIREGIRPDGSLIGPPMPFEVYKGISDDDLASVVMYLRTIPAVENKTEKSVYHIPLPPAYGPAIETVAAVPEGVTAEYGAYLAGPLGHCIVCHTPFGPNGQPQFDTMLGAGGNAFPGPWGTSVSANLTPTGLGGYTDDQLKAIITKGVRPDGSHLFPPMGVAYYANLNSNDLDAIVLYLRGLPAKDMPKQ